MKKMAVKYLESNHLLHMDMLWPIKRGSAEIIYAGFDGVMLKETESGAYMLSVDSFEKGKELLNSAENAVAFTLHQQFLLDYVKENFGFADFIESLQAVYLSRERLPLRGLINISQLKMEDLEFVSKHYNTIGPEYIEKRLKAGALYGGFDGNTLCGFIGTHAEGSIGMLAVLDEYRNRGYGTELESFMINHLQDGGKIPFTQVSVDNVKSINLQKKLGFEISDEKVYWLFYMERHN